MYLHKKLIYIYIELIKYIILTMSRNLKLVSPYISRYINTAKWENAQVYNIGNKVGMTEYIDFISSTDFPEKCNLMYGVDCYSRFFLTHNYKDKDNNNCVMTLFQRYTDETDFFVNCSDTFNNVGVKTSKFSLGRINEYHQHMFDLINNESIEVIDHNDIPVKYTSV